ncbi:salivary glue protein Sgs-4-like [Procambarus clarkii]|uniref:salivary glue protein Sgs-4-like n=1 Tax=Procambarus clarkii TaxID=6728 RepID=UPI001E678C2D|nr:salivary glue protein Sgs-4-like [Procambarus clarkii]
MPPEMESMPPETESMPPETESMPPETESMPPETESMPPETDSMPPERDSMPPERESMPPETESMPPETESMPPERESMPIISLITHQSRVSKHLPPISTLNTSRNLSTPLSTYNNPSTSHPISYTPLHLPHPIRKHRPPAWPKSLRRKR